MWRGRKESLSWRNFSKSSRITLSTWQRNERVEIGPRIWIFLRTFSWCREPMSHRTAVLSIGWTAPIWTMPSLTKILRPLINLTRVKSMEHCQGAKPSPNFNSTQTEQLLWHLKTLGRISVTATLWVATYFGDSNRYFCRRQILIRPHRSELKISKLKTITLVLRPMRSIYKRFISNKL